VQGDSLWALSPENSPLSEAGFQDVIATDDNGFLALSDIAIKGDKEGNIEWIFDGSLLSFNQAFPQFKSIIPLSDGFALLGNLRRPNEPENGSDFVFVKLTSKGEMAFFKIYDVGPYDDAQRITYINEGGYMLSGTKEDGKGAMMYFARLDNDGLVQWDREYNLSSFNANQGLAAFHTIDDEYILLGMTGNAPPRHNQLVLRKIRAVE
jgi:hypothetical protein